MSHASSQRRLSRSALFEVFEKRLMLAAQPIVPFDGIEAAPADDVPLTQNVLDLDDTSLQRPELLLEEVRLALEEVQRPELLAGDVQTTLADVHASTGLTYLRNEYGFTGTGQTVAVIDSGIAYDHYALGGGFGDGYRVVGGWDFTEENDADPYDDAPAGFHGTHVAGIIGSDDSVFEGVAPDVDLVALRVFNDQGNGWFSWVEDALQWVHDNRDSFANPITTVNLSIGTTWNADTVPNWAMLEDEFAQLESDGIFIAVSAGNSFGSYNTTGVSYPAASSFVVPVASTDNAGNMSGFSQRNSRVIAAPGESITSTVPDYLFGFDGVTDDWATASGTSMAAPYVAGASVLLRQAMEFVGYQNVTQDTIYGLMQSTADMVYDSVTGQYYNNLNLENAIEAIMPDDDYGSSSATAFDIGPFDDSVQLNGLIGTLTDRDYFTFTADQSGVATFDVQWEQQVGTDWQLDQSGGTVDGNTLTFDVVAGRTYTASLGTDSGLAFYGIDATFEASITDLGVVEQLEVADQKLFSSEKWFELTAERDGLLTVEAMFDGSGGNVSLELYNAANQLLASSDTSGDLERVDVTVGAGETFLVKIAGVNDDVDLRLTNLVRVAGDTVDVFGTAADDVFAFVAGATHQVTVNGVAYQFDGAVISTVNFRGAAGADTIRMTGTAADETATLRPGSVSLIGPQYDAYAEGIETVTVIAGGGNDVAKLYDSAGDDTFTAYPKWASLSGAGFRNVVGGFDQVDGYATAGGYDVAKLYDSAGDDTFTAYPKWASLSGAGFRNLAGGFDQVDGYATTGGYDVAKLYDSAGDDTFTAYPKWALLSGAGFRNLVGGFDQVDGYATTGGYDVAKFYDSAGDDAFTAYPKWASLSGAGFRNLVGGFDQVYGYATTGGYDVAKFYDSAGDDTFTATPKWASLSGAGFRNVVGGFAQVDGYTTTGGYDVANLYDSVGNDVFLVRGNNVESSGSGYSNNATGFARAKVFASDGDDRLIFDEVGSGDSLYGNLDLALFSRLAALIHGYDFDRVTARISNNATPDVEMNSIDYIYEQVGIGG